MTDLPSFSWAAARFPLPGTKRVYLHQPCDAWLVKARPDLKIQIQAATGGGDISGFGFVLLEDGTPVSFDFDRVVEQFEAGALPMLTQWVAQAGFLFEQVVFTTVDPTGRSLLRLRLRVTPSSDHSRGALVLGWLAVQQPHARFHSHPNEDYIVFESWAPAWESGRGLVDDGGVLHAEGVVVAVLRGSDNVTIVPACSPDEPLILELSFGGAREAVVEAVVPYGALFRREEVGRLLAVAFDEAYTRQTQVWQEQLGRAARISVPEPVVTQIYDTLTVTSLQFLGRTPGEAYLKPGQGGFNDFSVVYGWESASFLTVMDRQGYAQEVRRVLDYLLTTQQDAGGGPEGDISTGEGSFRPHIHWMCETGAILYSFAQHALYHSDWAGLRREAEALLKAARWIEGQRARTKVLASDGSQPLHYGLMPRGRASDWPDRGYQFFTDAYTWQGLDALAAAFEAAGFAEARWLREAADDYRRCIAEAVAGALKPHPLDPALTWVPDEVYEDPVKALPTTIWAGPQGLLGAGVFPADHPIVALVEASLRASGCLGDLFAFKMKTMEEPVLKELQERSAGGKVDLYYVTNWERIWHRLWLERGARIPALRFFYMTLAYATSRDVHMAHERFCPQLPWLLPWQPNASGGGRVLDMILTALLFEKTDALCLLYGVPDAWFAAKQPVGVTGLGTSFGTFSFTVTPMESAGSYEFAYTCEGRVPARFLLALPSGLGTEDRRIVEIPSRGRKQATEVV